MMVPECWASAALAPAARSSLTATGCPKIRPPGTRSAVSAHTRTTRRFFSSFRMPLSLPYARGKALPTDTVGRATSEIEDYRSSPPTSPATFHPCVIRRSEYELDAPLDLPGLAGRRPDEEAPRRDDAARIVVIDGIG